eukprot:CFRG2234T1
MPLSPKPADTGQYAQQNVVPQTRCAVCIIPLSQGHYSLNGKSYCDRHFKSKFVVKCNGCQEHIEGPNIPVGDEQFYHPECFTCRQCREIIPADSNFGLRFRAPFCQKCFEGRRTPLNRPISNHFTPWEDAGSGDEIRPAVQLPAHMSERGGKGDNGLPKSRQNVTRRSAGSIEENLGACVDTYGDESGSGSGNGIEGDLIAQKKVEPDTASITSKDSVDFTLKTFLSENPVAGAARFIGKKISRRYNKRTARRREDHVIRNFRLDDLSWGPELGQGFFGSVHLCTHKATGEKMAVKEMKASTDKEGCEAFQREVTLLRRLRNPNVLEFYGVFILKDHSMLLITEYIGGGTLHHYLKDKSKPLEWDRRLSFLHDIAKGCSYLHLNDVIHRDLTSKNCLIRADMSVCVADFGLARVAERKPTRMSVVGSPYWMAPEMLHGKQYNHSADVFSFGIIMGEVAARIKAEPDVFPRTHEFGVDYDGLEKLCSSQMPFDFFQLLIACTNMNPASRPSFAEVAIVMDAVAYTLEDETASQPNRITRSHSFDKLTQSRLSQMMGRRVVVSAEQTVSKEKDKRRKFAAAKAKAKLGEKQSVSEGDVVNGYESVGMDVLKTEVPKQAVEKFGSCEGENGGPMDSRDTAAHYMPVEDENCVPRHPQLKLTSVTRTPSTPSSPLRLRRDAASSSITSSESFPMISSVEMVPLIEPTRRLRPAGLSQPSTQASNVSALEHTPIHVYTQAIHIRSSSPIGCADTPVPSLVSYTDTLKATRRSTNESYMVQDIASDLVNATLAKTTYVDTLSTYPGQSDTSAHIPAKIAILRTPMPTLNVEGEELHSSANPELFQPHNAIGVLESSSVNRIDDEVNRVGSIIIEDQGLSLVDPAIGRAAICMGECDGIHERENIIESDSVHTSTNDSSSTGEAEGACEGDHAYAQVFRKKQVFLDSTVPLPGISSATKVGNHHDVCAVVHMSTLEVDPAVYTYSSQPTVSVCHNHIHEQGDKPTQMSISSTVAEESENQPSIFTSRILASADGNGARMPRRGSESTARSAQEAISVVKVRHADKATRRTESARMIRKAEPHGLSRMSRRTDNSITTTRTDVPTTTDLSPPKLAQV